MASVSDVSDELKALAYLSMRSGIPIPDLMDMEPIYLDAYFAVLADEANRK